MLPTNLHTIENMTMRSMALPVIRLALKSDHVQLARMRGLLWPDASFEEHLLELENVQVGGLPSESFVAVGEDGNLIGFVDVGLRSHADGCSPLRPVGFVEGWFVQSGYRKQGVGGALMRIAESWAGEQGCKEMASDTWIDHEDSQLAHEALGFEVVDRCVHYRKEI
jgi:aminoglycoside 6'-N-acetyltransferase I